MKSAITKRSIELNGHKTSVSLEDEFWDGLRAIAGLQKKPLSALLHGIDAGRSHANLSSAIRVFVLSYYRGRTGELSLPRERPEPPLPAPATSFPC